jgi:hypothetical protein
MARVEPDEVELLFRVLFNIQSDVQETLALLREEEDGEEDDA